MTRYEYFSKVLDFVAPVTRFFTTELLRQDYLIIEDDSPPSIDNHTTLKEQRLHHLCMMAGYRNQMECNQIQSRLQSRRRPHSAQALTLLLIESYLPHCIKRIDTKAESNVTDKPMKSTLVVSELVIGLERYQLELTPEIHALMIDNSGALLAA